MLLSYDGMNKDVIDEGTSEYSELPSKYTKAWSVMVVTSVVIHTLERVWSPDECIYSEKHYVYALVNDWQSIE